MISTSFALFAVIVLLTGLTLLAVGMCNQIDGIVLSGLLCLAIEAACIIAVSMLMINGEMQLWKTDKLTEHIAEITKTKEQTPNCYTINNNKLCGEFIYEDATHRYEYKNNTLLINLK